MVHKAGRLIPERGQHRRGSDPSLCTDSVRQFGSNLEDPITAAMPVRGAGFQLSSCPGSLCVNFKRDGW